MSRAAKEKLTLDNIVRSIYCTIEKKSVKFLRDNDTKRERVCHYTLRKIINNCLTSKIKVAIQYTVFFYINITVLRETEEIIIKKQKTKQYNETQDRARNQVLLYTSIIIVIIKKLDFDEETMACNNVSRFIGKCVKIRESTYREAREIEERTIALYITKSARVESSGQRRRSMYRVSVRVCVCARG